MLISGCLTVQVQEMREKKVQALQGELAQIQEEKALQEVAEAYVSKFLLMTWSGASVFS